MNVSRILIVALALLLVAQPAMAAVTAIDKDHSLYGDSAKKQFESTGKATATLVAPEVSLTVSEDKDGCGVKSWRHTDVAHDYICVEYREDVPRTIRFYVPRGYVGAHSGTIESIDEEHTATVSKSASGDLIVEVRFDGPGRATFALPEASAQFQNLRDVQNDVVENATGVSLEKSSDWQYPDQSSLSAESGGYTVHLPDGVSPGDVIVQFGEGDDSWSTAGTSSDTRKPIYVVERDGVDDRLYVHSTVAEPPQVRYKTNPGLRDQFGSVFHEIKQAPGRFVRMINALF